PPGQPRARRRAIRHGGARDVGGADPPAPLRPRRAGGPAARRPSRPWSAGAAAAALVFLILASALAYYSIQRPPEEPPRLVLTMPKPGYALGETVTVTVWLENGGGGERVYTLPTPQLFMLEIHNESGRVLVAYDTGEGGPPTELRLGAGEKKRLGTFEWNQTEEAAADGNVTWEQVPPGTYRILAWLNGHMDIQAERRIEIT
ncbi:MAG: hypothetical protein ACUVV6_05515, partial [Thermoplasmatota archaeon]